MPNSIRYVALSYVWGQVDTYRLLKGNYTDLMKYDGLTKNWEKLPRTIRDVILFTEAIGERYLWIDTLCLIQDDDNDKIPGIKHMDIIFSRAFCTIVAASGEDANSGIPGWGIIRRRAQQASEVLPGVNLILTKGMSTYLRQTRYDKRAWTFQEYFLSSRRIIFVNSQAYYVCRECYWREDDAETKRLNKNSWIDESYLSVLNDLWMDDDSEADHMLISMLSKYTTRQLTYASDILNAMGGIFRALSIRYKCSFFQGMPIAALNLYLLFDTIDNSDRRLGFPSYSWAGWHGQIVFSRSGDDAGNNDWLSNHTWIIWYKYDPLTGAVSQVSDINRNPGLIESTKDGTGYRNRQAFRPKSAASRLSCNAATTKPSTLHHMTGETRYSYPLLQFWTVQVHFKVTISREQGIERDFRGLVLDILDRNGDYCGCVRTNQASAGIHAEDPKPIELILLSEEDWVRWPEIGEYIRKNKSREEYSKDFEDRCMFWALWVLWDGAVSERVGIAQIFQAAMEESLEPGPVWKEILLG